LTCYIYLLSLLELGSHRVDSRCTSGIERPMAAQGAAPQPAKEALEESPIAPVARAVKQEAAPVSALPAEGEAASTGAQLAGGQVALQKLHILPFKESENNLQGKTRLQCITPELLRKRASEDIVKAGDLIRHDNFEFAVIKAEPPEGILGLDTDYFLDGSPIVCFEKIQFSAWGPTVMTEEELFQECITQHCAGDYKPYTAFGSKRVRLFYLNQIIQIGNVFLQVEATEPSGLGVVTTDTDIFANWDDTPEFDKVHIVPFQDTLPRAYQFDIFHDYLKPYLVRNSHKKFQENELFMYQGVQFKMVACEPNALARIGKNTTIYCEGMLNPSLRNLLPPELLNQVTQLPPGLQMLLLNTERTTRELEDMLTQQRGLFEETLQEIESFNWPPSNTNSHMNQKTCMICLGDFQIGDDCRRLPCRHVFHAPV